MLHKTRGVVFNATDYGEASLVVKIYTELFGIQSYLINGVRKKHARVHSNIFQPLTPLDLVVYHKDRPGLQRISEISPSPPLNHIPFDVVKTSIVFFLDEVLLKAIREEESNPGLFEFIFNSIQYLDNPEKTGKEFHLIFLVRLSRLLGFSPTNNFNDKWNIFNLKDGSFQESFPNHPHFIPPPLSRSFFEMLNAEYSLSTKISGADRRLLINYIIEYFELHVAGFGNIKSHKVLEQVWED